MDALQHFNKSGQLLNGTYYFDPPLEEYEIQELYHLWHPKVNASHVILIPLRPGRPKTKTILYLEVYNNEIEGWQDVDFDEDENGTYILNNLAAIKRWCQNNECREPFHNGRVFLSPRLDTEAIFTKINK